MTVQVANKDPKSEVNIEVKSDDDTSFEPISGWPNVETKNETEVVAKFIVPLLDKLNFSENDRHFELPISMKTGVSKKPGRIDVGLFARDKKKLDGRVLLIVEAKSPRIRLKEKQADQIESYAHNTYSHFGLLTNGKEIIVYHFPVGMKPKEVFNCKKEELHEKRLSKLSSIISKAALVKHYNGFAND